MREMNEPKIAFFFLNKTHLKQTSFDAKNIYKPCVAELVICSEVRGHFQGNKHVLNQENNT